TVDVEDLRRQLGGGPSTPAPATYGTVQMPAIKPAAPAADPTAVRAALQRASESRDWTGVLTLAAQQQALGAGDAALRALAEDPQAHAEAEPYTRRFLDGARRAIDSGDTAEAERLLQKASSLDGTHPEVADLRRLLATSAPVEEPPLSLDDLPHDLDL